MPRLDAPEIADQPWCPAWLRDAMTGYLQVVIEQSRPYDVAIPVISRLLEETGSSTVVDLGSGAGGPWRQIHGPIASSGISLAVTLTDVEPNEQALVELGADGPVRYRGGSVSALEVPADLRGIRTMFTALHHFDPDQVRSILESAQRERVGFAAFEATHRSVRGLLVTLLVPLIVLFLMPRVRPRRLLPLLLTYLPPVLPLLIWWDGFASTLRTYSAHELRELAAEIAVPGYSWDVQEVRVPRAPIPVLQLVGRPDPKGSGSPEL